MDIEKQQEEGLLFDNHYWMEINNLLPEIAENGAYLEHVDNGAGVLVHDAILPNDEADNAGDDAL